MTTNPEDKGEGDEEHADDSESSLTVALLLLIPFILLLPWGIISNLE